MRTGILGSGSPVTPSDLEINLDRRSSLVSYGALTVDVGDGMPLAVAVKVNGGEGKLLNENSLRMDEGIPTEEFERLSSFAPPALTGPSAKSEESRLDCSCGDKRRKAAMLLSNSVCWRRSSVNDTALLLVRAVLAGVSRP